MAKSKYIEALEEQYTKKDAKSVLRYKAPDNKWRYVQTSKDASGGNMPSGGGITEVTWQELKDKRDNGELNPGSLYRITDYNCTTTQENTQSAGHQFDIVLLALSEDKLAEEGWAMEHPTDVYDVTFADGVTKKCWIYKYFYKYNNSMVCNLISIENKLGAEAATFTDDKTASHDDYNLIINEENKTATYDDTSGDSTEDIMSVPNLPYNYFQNSNLSAWKVWYCLDNDTARFAWADDSVDEDSPASIEVNGGEAFERSEVDDVSSGEFRYAWRFGDFVLYTQNTTPSQGDSVYFDPSGIGKTDEIEAYNPPQEGTGLPNGRGVIYRLIDEWGNDCPYDFKNIVIYLGGKIEKGHLFSSADGDIFSDMSLTGIFNDITVKKTIDDNNCQVIDMGIIVTDAATERCNIIVASGALSEDGVNSPSSNKILGYTIV